ncbi:hypothetical protein E2N92_12090 [Methanofollis formosanus]|uniref:Uncharacterized protein n=1 Tax=Methanofollis formosanus TaxID=299308 RepID=A0A8G1EGS0_9EURY|nr:hypothetical protein [Methanofollis formosanus]QYZ80113.1 hypothetical protein E2N92_12090 [Methanofollis formosanus]
MDPKTAVLNYQYGERAKSELILASRLVASMPGFPSGERMGGKRMLLMVLEGVRSEIAFAHGSSGHDGFRKALEAMDAAIAAAEGLNFEEAVEKIAEAVSASTTVAQESWEALAGHGLL